MKDQRVKHSKQDIHPLFILINVYDQKRFLLGVWANTEFGSHISGYMMNFTIVRNLTASL